MAQAYGGQSRRGRNRRLAARGQRRGVPDARLSCPGRPEGAHARLPLPCRPLPPTLVTVFCKTGAIEPRALGQGCECARCWLVANRCVWDKCPDRGAGPSGSPPAARPAPWAVPAARPPEVTLSGVESGRVFPPVWLLGRGVRPAVCIRAALSSCWGFSRGEGPVAGPSWPRGVTAEGRRPGASVGSGFCDLSLGPMHRWVLEARVSVQPRPVAGVGGLGGSPWRHSRPHLRCGPASHPCQGPAASPGHLTWPAFLRRE